MGAFELNSSTHRNETRNDIRNDTHAEVHNAESLDSKRPRTECIIALKVYDGCSLKECLDDLGPARLMDNCECTNMVVHVPNNADEVTVDCVRIRDVNVRKQPSRFKSCAGYWDIFLEFVFEYRLTFFQNDEVVNDCKQYWACSTFRKRITLFGGPSNDLAFVTDLFNRSCEGNIGNGPFVSVEAKAIALCAKIGDAVREERCEGFGRREVFVTIGLYAIIRLFRIVNLNVESRGFCEIPEECECGDVDCLNPCDFFNKLAFPEDLFRPSVKPEC